MSRMWKSNERNKMNAVVFMFLQNAEFSHNFLLLAKFISRNSTVKFLVVLFNKLTGLHPSLVISVAHYDHFEHSEGRVELLLLKLNYKLHHLTLWGITKPAINTLNTILWDWRL